jgi:sugar phosphate isomerase/epimerase
MKLGLSSYTYTWAVGVPGQLPQHPLTALGLLERAAELGVSVVQFADNLPLHKLDHAEIDHLAERATALGIDIEVGARGIAPDHLSRYIALAQRLGSPIVRVVVERPGEHLTPESVADILHPQRDAFEAAGIVLAIENHDHFAVSVLTALVRQLGSTWVGICLDTVNSFGALEGPRVVVDALGPLTVNLHVKDFLVTRASHAMGFSIEGTPAGRGQLDVPWLLAELSAHGREFNAILELWTPPESDVEATIAKERQWAEWSVAYLDDVLARPRIPAASPAHPATADNIR